MNKFTKLAYDLRDAKPGDKTHIDLGDGYSAVVETTPTQHRLYDLGKGAKMVFVGSYARTVAGVDEIITELRMWS